MRTRPLVFFVFLTLAAASAGWAAPVQDKILKDEDSVEAARFLADSAAQAELRKSDETAYLSLFRKAAELKDVADVLRTHDFTSSLREALLARQDSSLCSEPNRLLAWAARYNLAVNPTALKAAVYDWDALSEVQRAWVIRRGGPPKVWGGLSLGARHAVLLEWAQSIQERITKTVPKSREEYDRLKVEANEISSILDGLTRRQMTRRLEQAQEAVSALEEVKKRLAVLQDPALQGLLEEAQSSGDLAGMMSRLGRVFDRLGVAKPAFDAARPAGEDQKFSDKERFLLAKLLSGGLMKQLEGTDVGEDLQTYYSRHPLKVSVHEMDQYIALYDSEKNEMTFNEIYVLDVLKARRGSIQGLLAGRDGVLDSLVMQLSPVFVHEATHQMQFSWTQEKGMPVEYGQPLEIEAYQNEALFMIDKSRCNERYRKFMEDAQESSTLAREAVGLAERFQRDPAYFRSVIVTSYYPEKFSPEGAAWSVMDFSASNVSDFEGELKRRAALPTREQEALRRGGNFTPGGMSSEQWQKELKAVATSALETHLARNREAIRRRPETYSLYRQRQGEENRRAEERLKKISESKCRVRAASEVPSPAVR